MIKKNKKYKFPDGIDRTIVDVERSRGNKTFTNSDYSCYYVDIPFEDGDEYFEKYSEYYEEILALNGFQPTPPNKYYHQT
jgi:hypothetical protein